ncbi:MAG: hypothetical protein NC084_13465 [Bacteroides sp.]|nr:hypothetical protein [Eubacterium sp.]MCM1419729.1 hypothetical protein [Roseburia sp.]MCM1463704.1 hypothetical protein [Bacteroides sp.]
MRHNTTEILNQLAELAKSYPFDKPEHDEAERLMKEFEETILQKLSPIVTEKFTSVPIKRKGSPKRRHKRF